MNNQTESNNDSEAGSQGQGGSSSLPLANIHNHDGPRTPTTTDGIELVNEGGLAATPNSVTTVRSDSEPFIFKVHNHLRGVNNKAYEPAIISIGPYHRNKPHLQLMEAHKLRFQKLMLKRNNEEPLSRYLDAIRPDEEQARKSYAESTPGLSPDEFVEMLVLDGIFIIELLWKFDKFVSERENCDSEIRNDPVFRMPWGLNLLQRDLMLFENQLPFFILVKLFGMIRPDCELSEFTSLALVFFNDLFPGRGEKREDSDDIKHLLDLIHMYWGSQRVSAGVNGACTMDNLEPMRCATKLREVGIKLVMIENEVSFDIKFENGKLRIPVLTIEYKTESLLRNLIAYEQYCGDSGFHTVTDYMTFFYFLIKTREDVERLARNGILKSFIGDEDTTRMFITICNCITGPSENFQYAQLCKRVNEHCKTRWNRYMAILRRDYANSPWGIISIIAAIALLSLTVLEVTFQILSWKLQKKAS